MTRKNSPRVAAWCSVRLAFGEFGSLETHAETDGRRALVSLLALGACGEHFQDELGTRPDERRVLVEKPAHVA